MTNYVRKLNKLRFATMKSTCTVIALRGLRLTQRAMRVMAATVGYQPTTVNG